MGWFGRARAEVGRSAGKMLAESSMPTGSRSSGAALTADGVYGRLPPWVTDIWNLRGAVGEVHNGSTFLANCMSRCQLMLGVIDERDNSVGPAFDDNGLPVEGVDPKLAQVGAKMIRSLRCNPLPGQGLPVGGQGMFLARIGANLGTVADCYAFGWDAGAGRYRWEIVSTEEARPIPLTESGGKQSFRRQRSRYGGMAETVTPDTVIRIFRSHPRASLDADSANEALRKTARRLALLTDEGLAESLSRLATPGMLLIPSEIEWPEDDDDDDSDYVTKTLMAVGAASIKDPDSPSRFLPVAFEVPGDRAEQFKLLKFGNDASIVAEKRLAAVGDYARGSEFPPEVTRGFGESSLANAFVINEQTSRIHVEPWLDVVAGCLTGGFLAPGLMLVEGLDPNNIPPPRIEKLVVWYSVSNLVSHTNPEKVANAGYGTVANPNDLISGRYWRMLNGLPEAAKPSKDEWEKRLADAHKVRMRSEVGGHKDPNNPTPEPGDDGISDEGPDQDEEVGKRTLALADYVVCRAKDRAGSWFRSKANGKPELAAKVRGVDNAEVARVLTPQVVQNLGDVETMLAGEWTTFERTVRDLFEHRDDVDEIATAAMALVRKDFALRLYAAGARQNARLAAEFMELLDA